MQIAAAAGMNRWSLGSAGNAIKLDRSGPHRARLMMLMWIILSGSLCLMVDGQMKLSPETVQKWAVSFGKEIASLSTRYSGAKLLQKKYKDVEGAVKIEEVNGEELVKKFAEEMEEMLGRKMKSVKSLAEAAEDADLYHEYNETLEFDYYNSMLINTVDEDGNPVPLGGEFQLEENEHFSKLAVNTQQSNIQVPTNVYNRDPDIVNGVYMSEALNDIFIDNFQKDPTLTWQYFGSSTGFFRLYPGIQWIPDENGVVTFDCRNRNWYIQAATSPKDVIIVVDVSGSMKGLRLTIAKHTINTILDTLGENDFVNIIAYSDYVRYVEPCFKGTLVQADLDNREHFKLLVEELHVKGEGKVKNAMMESFKILNEAAALGQGSLCNQAIMLITDGAMEDFQDVFEKFNWPERRVRVFTYLIGREMTFAENVKWIACNNKGYYTHISTLADVQENVMEYLHVLSRPMVINHDHDIIWTEAYMDSVFPNKDELFNTQAQSLLLMTSVAMPVFSKKKETLSHGILLGVVGTDVALKELMRLAPRYKLGVHGYAYLITNNGYILSHPDLRPLYKEGKKLKPKPNYNSVDLSEVEWEDTEEKLRTAMVKGETGTLFLDVRTSVDKGTRVMFLRNDYFYTVINETPFSLGIVLSRGYGQYIFIGNVSVEEGLHDLLAPDLTIASEWTYCETDIDPAHRKLNQLQAVVRYLTGKEPDLECDVQLLQQTLFDAVVTAPMEAYWTALMLNTSGMDDGVETAFLGTRSGLMRFQRYTGIEKRIAKSFLTSTDKENMFTLDHFPVWYRRAAEYPAGQFLYYMPRQETRAGRIVIATTAVTVTVGKKTAIAGAIGVQMTLELIESKFWAIAAQPNDTDCSGVEGICPLRCDSVDIDCYVIDNNGFVLISKQRNDAGRFYGEVDGSVMTTLIRMGMFKRVSLFDYQAMCKINSHSVSSARPLLSPFYGLASTLKWFLSNFLLFLLEFNICGFWHMEHFAEAKPPFSASSAHKKKGDILQPCDTEYPSFVYEPSVKETNSIIKCGRCQKMFVVQQIPDSNLLMLVVQADCDCSRQYSRITMEPKEVKYIASVKCDRMRSQKIRRRPESCHSFHPQENADDCGGASFISLSTSLFFTCLTFAALVS
ncbi:voltage-dependent calcium channel subunit alpha-2/delta-4 isoform X1 [Amphiprion ocellaris]|uniref:voltage-dependent calcium channel subunit alpha-2/delta-4 isoform X1 n=1 Tax=Amphiprion ocellaris TaxID=80972 RepID=UPI002410F70D|nr:voltage-dependent calcium channel subunit alpha-2/delta-4 isoform X1 [Amphiprion ocellaris]XP_054862488.1 voltage-dependent calcium channel subunit alpha-2/delta-4 isoform X1 [Amphiprion ocellaris]XP_054862489.1 voltage-dependent calcium channel subunit alpha-2/delta-4 isoform X1 [Amphiprion ocellaris]XP_054862490.1 voltage-dependent calcium channel subunit alpha-2/delta-4 isoform X1 [Amphiprion ocellaris]